MEKEIHQGRNIKRFREMMGIKQDALALDLGESWNQKKVSMLEQKATIEPGLLQQVADALKIPADAIRNFDEDTAIMNIQHNYDGSYNQGAYSNNYHCTFNPVEKWAEATEEIKRLYEALLKSEREKNALLEKMMEEMRK
jgi:transcriptional regulator with XRE-family HTH domain